MRPEETSGNLPAHLSTGSYSTSKSLCVNLSRISVCPTILHGGHSHFAGGRSWSCAVACLNHHLILCELLQVVQGERLRLTRALHAQADELVASIHRVLPVAHLIASDHTVLQVFLRSLMRNDEA